MKTLLKLAKQRNSIPILGMVYAKNDRLLATNLDTLISVPIPDNLEDGKLYHPEGLDKGLIVESDISAADWPEMFDLGAVKKTLFVNADDLAFVAIAMSTEQVRYYLNGICFNGADMVSTDGHRLHKVDLGGSTEGRVIVPAEAVKFILEMAKEIREKQIIIMFCQHGISAHVGGMALFSKYVDGTFPDYNIVIPRVEADNLAGRWDADTFKAQHKEIKILAKIAGNRQAPVRIQTDGRIACHYNGIQEKWWKVEVKPQSDIGFNADYLKDVCSGDMYVSESRNPAVFVDGNKLAVLMPLRV